MQLELFPAAELGTRGPAGPARPPWLVILVLVLFFFWACWATAKILGHRERPVVSVDLGRIMSEFIREETARDLPPEEAAVRAAMFARLAEEGVSVLAADGSLVLVSQAVVGQSARDATSDLMRYIDRRIAETPSAPALRIPVPMAEAEPRPGPEMFDDR